MSSLFRVLLCLLPVLLVISCAKEIDDNYVALDDEDPKAWLLNEGSWNGNNSEISLVSLASGAISNNHFNYVNHRRLGDLGQDVVAYGGKLYVTLFSSNVVEVIDMYTGKSVAQITMGDRQPRYMAVGNGKVYVSCYTPHSVVAIDTATFQISATCQIDGSCPEQLCILRDSLYVCCAWQYANNGSFIYDDKLCVINLSTFSQVGSIKVGDNLNSVKVLNNNCLATCYWGNYSTSKAGVSVVDVSATPAVVTSCGVEATQIDCYKGDIYCFNFDNGNYAMQFWRIDGVSLQKTAILSSAQSLLRNPYHLTVNQANGDIFVTDAQFFSANGDLYCFSSDGVLRWRCEASTAPTKLVVVP